MSESLDKLFAITSEPLCPVDQTRSEFREDRLAAMRIGRETAWRRYREAEGDKTEALAKARKRGINWSLESGNAAEAMLVY